mmetsp:Transcript_36509/g.36105  ORF Transcript_36509/g.36105 Transcript_36509/m.36105 type:complete len:114 (+) Transcript_36509:174-515(+)
MRKYDNSKQDKVYKFAKDFESKVRRLNELAPTLDGIQLPPDLIALINYDLKTASMEESKDEKETTKDSILKKFHEDLNDRVLYSTQLGRGTNKAFKKLERQMKKKVQSVIADI